MSVIAPVKTQEKSSLIYQPDNHDFSPCDQCAGEGRWTRKRRWRPQPACLQARPPGSKNEKIDILTFFLKLLQETFFESVAYLLILKVFSFIVQQVMFRVIPNTNITEIDIKWNFFCPPLPGRRAWACGARGRRRRRRRLRGTRPLRRGTAGTGGKGTRSPARRSWSKGSFKRELEKE